MTEKDLDYLLAPLVASGLIKPPTWFGVPPQSTSEPLPPGQLEKDLAADREDRVLTLFDVQAKALRQLAEWAGQPDMAPDELSQYIRENAKLRTRL